MKPKALMLLGCFAGLIAWFGAAVMEGATFAVLGFGGGMVFGKGYGIWEERDSRRRMAEQEAGR